MSKNQTLSELSAKILISLNDVLSKEKPDYVFVHGDTTTSFIASIASFYNQIKSVTLKQIKTYDKYSPFPEEMNRTLTGKLTDLHFAPTLQAKKSF